MSEAGGQFDFVVFGAGFGGSILSMVLRRLGFSVLLLERGKHPRFVIGESSTPFANLLLERIADRFDLPFLRWLSEWGSWRERFPNLPVGLKRGFTFFHHADGAPLDLADRRAQLLVAASPNDAVADTHWYRPEFDLFLVNAARELGVRYRDSFNPAEFQPEGSGWIVSDGQSSFRARFAIDASGPGGFLARRLGLEGAPLRGMPPARGIYAHFREVAPLEFSAADLPYPPESAAVHHVFRDGWIWVLRFNNGVTSAGAALKSPPTGQPSADEWNALLAGLPSLRAQFANARVVTPFFSTERLSFRRGRAAGDRWALLPSAAGFVDPLLSTGFALNLLGIWRLGEIFGGDHDLSGYEARTFEELDAAGDLIGALYAKMDSFPEFARLTLLYFAAMSFTESAWRLHREELASSFLLVNNEAFTRARRELCESARAGGDITREAIGRAIAPFDVAGLTDWRRENWYAVDFGDLLQNRHKLRAGEAEIGEYIRTVMAKPATTCPAPPARSAMG